MTRTDEQEVASVPEIKVPKRTFAELSREFKAPSLPYPKLNFAPRSAEFNISPDLREDPRRMFELFITNDDFAQLASHTNLHAAFRLAQENSQHSTGGWAPGTEKGPIRQ